MIKKALGLFLLTGALLALFGFFGVANPAHQVKAAGASYSKGDVFIGTSGGTIKHFSSTGVLLDTLNSSQSSFETGMIFDATGNLYSTDFSSNTISKFDNAGNLIGPFATSSLSNPESIVQDAAGNYYVGNAPFSGKIVKLSSSGAVLAVYTVAAQNRGADWIELSPDQCTIYYTSEGSTIFRFNVCTNTQLPNLVTLPTTLYALRLLSDGSLLVAGTTTIYRVNSTGTVVTPYPGPAGAIALFALNLDPDGVHVWTGDAITGKVYKYAIDIPAPPVFSFNANLSGFLTGLAVFGEVTLANPPHKVVQKQTIAPPDMVIQLRTEPNLTAALGTSTTQSVVSYTLNVKNMGLGKADSFMVNFPVDPASEDVLSVDFPSNSVDNPQSWVTAVTTDTITMQFGSFEASSNSTPISLTANIRLAIKSSATSGATLVTRATGWASWSGGSALMTRSNSVSFDLGSSSQGDGTKDGIQPISAALTKDNTGVVIGGDIFIPGEIISGWINMPDGTVKGIGTSIGRADQNGLILIGYSLFNLPAGSYSIVLYGNRSEVQGVGSFSITNPVTQSLPRFGFSPFGRPNTTLEKKSK